MDTQIDKPVAIIFGFLIITGSLNAVAVFYEPFRYDNPGDELLDGKSPVFGTANAWDASSNFIITDKHTFGGTDTTSPPQLFRNGNIFGFNGGRVAHDGGGQIATASLDLGNLLTTNGLLDDDRKLWFSAAFRYSNIGSTYLTLGTGGPDGFDRIGGDTGNGLGFRIEDGNVFAHGWREASSSEPEGKTVPAVGSLSISDADPLGRGNIFVVGRITWAADGAEDTLDVYLPEQGLIYWPGFATSPEVAPASTISFDFDQSRFTTLGLAGVGDNGKPGFDEIRIGSTLGDVQTVPEPSSFLSLSIGGLFLTFLRRCSALRR